MVKKKIYECKLCNLCTHLKTDFTRHQITKKHKNKVKMEEELRLNKKNHIIDSQMTPIDSQMTPIDSQMTPIDSKNHKNDSKNHKNDSKNHKNDSKNHKNDSKNHKNDSEMTPGDSYPIYTCKFCKQKYSKNSNLHRHMKKCTKKDENKIVSIKEESDNTKLLEYIKIIEKEKKAIRKENQLIAKEKKAMRKENQLITKEKKAMRKEIEKLIDKVGDITTNNIMNNTINIVAPNNFTQENLDYLTGDYLDGLLKIPYGSILDLLKHIHFNPKHPENHNIKIPNRKEKFAIVYSKGKWEIRVKKEVIGDMVDTAYNIIDCHYDEVKNTLEFSRKDRFNNYQSSYDKDNKTRQKIETDV
jgi:hypothetical protein